MKELKVGNKVIGIFRKYGNHKILGEVIDISNNEHGLPGKWVSILVLDGDKSDEALKFYIEKRILVLIPFQDVLEIVC